MILRNSTRAGVLTGALVLAVATLGAIPATAGSVAIQEVYVDKWAPGTIQIVGQGFGTDPHVTLGTFGALDLWVASENLIVAALPLGIGDGQYKLLVTVSPTGSAGGCETGKPVALAFQYTGGSCLDTTNLQEGKLECDGDAAGAEPVRVRVAGKHGEKTEVEPSDESVEIGDTVMVIATHKKLKAETRLGIEQGGLVLQSLAIHTSCSKPLAVGDQFGSLLLTGFFPEGSDESDFSDNSDEFDMVIAAGDDGGGPPPN